MSKIIRIAVFRHSFCLALKILLIDKPIAMITNTYDEVKTLRGEVKYLPAISIILPFEPVMSLKTELEYRLKRAMEKVETELMANYPVHTAVPVIVKLQNLIHQLNYNTHKKSIAIFVSPLVEKIYYLDIRVEEKIVIDESFEIRDLVYSKKQNIQYLVLLLSAERSKMYLGNCSKFVLIKSNAPDNIYAYKNDIAERVGNFSDPDKRKETLIDKFLHHMDEGLSIILKAYSLPVFVLGPERVLGHFKKITRNKEKLVQFIHGNYDEATEPEIRDALQPYINNWRKVKEQDLLQQLESAMNGKKLAIGIQDAWTSAAHKNSRLLVVEKDFVYPGQIVNAETISPRDANANNPFYVKDAVDDVMEKVLQNGGDVEFVENGILKDYDRIALIQYY